MPQRLAQFHLGPIRITIDFHTQPDLLDEHMAQPPRLEMQDNANSVQSTSLSAEVEERFVNYVSKLGQMPNRPIILVEREKTYAQFCLDGGTNELHCEVISHLASINLSDANMHELTQIGVSPPRDSLSAPKRRFIGVVRQVTDNGAGKCIEKTL